MGGLSAMAGQPQLSRSNPLLAAANVFACGAFSLTARCLGGIGDIADRMALHAPYGEFLF